MLFSLQLINGGNIETRTFTLMWSCRLRSYMALYSSMIFFRSTSHRLTSTLSRVSSQVPRRCATHSQSSDQGTALQCSADNRSNSVCLKSVDCQRDLKLSFKTWRKIETTLRQRHSFVQYTHKSILAVIQTYFHGLVELLSKERRCVPGTFHLKKRPT